MGLRTARYLLNKMSRSTELPFGERENFIVALKPVVKFEKNTLFYVLICAWVINYRPITFQGVIHVVE